MRAIDTDVLVRFLVADDKGHARKARTAIAAGDILVPMTVLLESEWLLRSAYGFAPDRIAEVLRRRRLPGITVERPARLAQAPNRMADGMDFADALHLGAAADCAVFLSFDRKLAKSAKERSSIAMRSP